MTQRPPDRLAPPVPPALPDRIRRGRGASHNGASTRFDQPERTPDPEQWEDEEPQPLKTFVSIEKARSILMRQTSPDLPFDRSINAYRGCEHGCVYCYARPTHAYLGLSPGLDFETRLLVKTNAPQLLEKELARPGYVAAPIAMGTNTDPYQPLERRFRVTRGLLQVLDRWNHPVTITTKSAAVLDDLDLLAGMAARRLAHVTLSLTTLDGRLARLMEPRASAPHRRLKAMAALARAGVPVNVAVSPLIPGLTDHALEAILTAARDAGARSASSIALRLPHEVAGLFEAWITGTQPDRAGKVLAAVRASHGGKLNDPRFGHRFKAQGPAGALVRQRFSQTCARLGLAERIESLDSSQFKPPPSPQLSLFG